MIGQLNDEQIDQVLHMQLYGRIACRWEKKIYVVPVSYCLSEKYLYARSREGLKVDILRKNPDVCFQVDIVDNLANWRSVIIWGRYEELKTGQDQAKARKILDSRFGPLHISRSISLPSENVLPPKSVEKKLKAVYFRIRINEKTGRFERPYDNE